VRSVEGMVRTRVLPSPVPPGPTSYAGSAVAAAAWAGDGGVPGPIRRARLHAVARALRRAWRARHARAVQARRRGARARDCGAPRNPARGARQHAVAEALRLARTAPTWVTRWAQGAAERAPLPVPAAHFRAVVARAVKVTGSAHAGVPCLAARCSVRDHVDLPDIPRRVHRGVHRARHRVLHALVAGGCVAVRAARTARAAGARTGRRVGPRLAAVAGRREASAARRDHCHGDRQGERRMQVPHGSNLPHSRASRSARSRRARLPRS